MRGVWRGFWGWTHYYIEMETKGARPGLGLWEGGKVDKDVRVGKDVKVGGGSGEWAN